MPHLTLSHYVTAMARASLALILLAVWKAYRLGRERGVGIRADRFDRLYAEVDFDGTSWQVADTSRVHQGKIVGTVNLTQLGARLRAEGVDHANRRWSAEGVVFRRGLHLLFVERRERGHAVGSMNLTLDETSQRMKFSAPDHRIAARCMLGLAELAQHEKRFDAAFPLLERSLAIMRATTSCARLELAQTLRLITENLLARNLPQEALPRAEELLETQHAILPQGHPETIPTWALLGQLRQRLNDPVGAEQAFQAVLAAQPSVTDALRTEMRSRLADVLIEQQKYDPAQRILDELIQQHPGHTALPWLSQLSGVLYLQSKFPEAADIMERCVELSELCHGPDSPETAKHLDNLAGVRFLLGQYETAEPVIQRAIQILEQEVPVRSAALNRARENYSQLLRSTGRSLEADQLEGLVLAAQAAEEPPSLTGSHVLDDL